MGNASNVVVAVSGAVYVAPAGSPGPTGAMSPLGRQWKSLGYLSAAGVTERFATDTNDITGWQNAAVVRRTVIKRQVTYDFTALETNLTTVGLFYNAGIASGGGGSGFTDLYEALYTDMYGQRVVAARVGAGDIYEALYTSHYGVGIPDSKPADHQPAPVAVVIDIVDGPVVIRRYAPQAVMVPEGNVTFSADQAIDYPLSCTCLPDPGIDGSVTVYYNRLLSG